MEYIFGYRGISEVVKTIGNQQEDLKGWQETLREYDDCTIKDKFLISRHIESRIGADGRYYNWYTITNHTRETDRWGLIKDTDNTADMAYVNSELALALLEETEE